MTNLMWYIRRMSLYLSIKGKLVLTASAGQELKSAMEEFNRACNTLSELAFQQDLHRKYDIHHAGYHLQGSQGGRGGRHSLASVHFSDLFAMFASGRPSESIEFPMPRLRLPDQRRSEWSEIYRQKA